MVAGIVTRPGTAVTVRPDHPTLDAYGVGVEWFEHYVNPRIALHELDVVLLTLVIEGRGTNLVAGERFDTIGPCLDVSRIGEPHSLVTGPEGMRVVNLYLAPDRHPLPSLGEGLDATLERLIPPAPPFVHRRNRLVRMRIGELGPLLDGVRALEAALRDERPGRMATVEAQLTLLLVAFARELQQQGLAEAPMSRTAEAVERARRVIDIDPAAPHTLASLAATANLERTYFSRVFAIHTGVGVVQYVNRQRVAAAMRALGRGDRTVAHVAGASGFRDLSHFTRTFRAVTGLTPREYRDGRRLGSGTEEAEPDSGA